MRKLKVIEHISLDGVIQTWNVGAERVFAGHYEGQYAFADLDGDVRPDLVITAYASDALGIALNDGSGGFPTFPTFATGLPSSPAALAAGEVARAYDPASRFLGLVTCGSEGRIRVERLFVPGAAGEDAETA